MSKPIELTIEEKLEAKEILMSSDPQAANLSDRQLAWLITKSSDAMILMTADAIVKRREAEALESIVKIGNRDIALLTEEAESRKRGDNVPGFSRN